MANEDVRRVGRAVAARRGELGMTQQELADAAGVDLKTVYNLESGGRWPIAKTRVAIAAALKWPGDALAEMTATLTVVPPPVVAGSAPEAGDAPDDSPPSPSAVAFARAFGVNPDNPNDPFLRSVRRAIADAIMTAGAGARGSQIFRGHPRAEAEARLWDDPAIPRRDKELLIAGMRAERGRGESGHGNGRARIGLPRPAASGVT